MCRFCQYVRDFLKREDGPTAVEYAVMLAFIITICVAAIQALGSNASASFDTVNTTLVAGS
jgi:pilus assembly protein Flp/PilA